MAKAAKQNLDNSAVDDDDMDSIISYSVNVEDQEKPPVLPLGEYRATVSAIEKKVGKDSGRPYLNIRFTISADDQPADFVEALGTQAPVSVFYMLFAAEDTPQSRYNMKQFCKALGVAGSDQINLKEFLNQEAKVQVEHQKDLNGDDQPRVRRVS